jgi:hypothetical protein
MKSTWEKWTRTKFKRGGTVPCSPTGPAWVLGFPIYGALYSGIMQQPPTVSLLLENLQLWYYWIGIILWTAVLKFVN